MTDAATKTVEALTPETFDFAQAVLDRDYPEIQVPVYLNEKKVQQLIDLLRERQELEIRASKTGGTKAPVDLAKRLGEIEKEHEKLTKELKAEEYIVSLKGIAPEDHDALHEAAKEIFPEEYTESTNPITGATIKTVIDSDERDEYLVATIRQAHLVSVTAPNGAVDADFKGEANIAKVKRTFARLPYIARFKIDEAIKEANIAVDFYRELADEVF